MVSLAAETVPRPAAVATVAATPATGRRRWSAVSADRTVSPTRRIARRVVFAVLSLYVVVTVAFAFVALTPDPNVAEVQYTAALEHRYAPPEERLALIQQEVEAYREARNLDEPVLSRYTRWLVDVSTFDWGLSTTINLPVITLIARQLPYTLAYVVPSMLLSAVGGIALGAYLALRDGSRLDRGGTVLAYVGFGIPTFWLAAALIHLTTQPIALGGGYYFQLDADVYTAVPPWAPENLLGIGLATFVLSTTLFASQLRHARMETLEHLGAEFVRLVRAKGLGPLGVLRHALRVAAVPLLSLLFVDLFGVLVVSVFVVEYVFGIPGFGTLTYDAIMARDVPLVLGTTMVVAFVGIFGTLLKDVAAVLLDPRIDEW